MTRRIRFAGREHQARETHARHIHTGEGGWMVYGDGATVLKVSRSRNRVVCDVIGEDGLNEWGDRFRYADYFLPEELS